MPTPTPSARDTERQLRASMLALSAAGAVGLAAELALVSHWHSWIQRVPLALCAVAFIMSSLVFWARTAVHVRVAQAGLVVVGLGGGLGIVKHLQANYGFSAEIHPSWNVPDLILPTLQGASPALAPTALTALAAIALLATWRHPLVTPQ